jgi:hypothetical protein
LQILIFENEGSRKLGLENTRVGDKFAPLGKSTSQKLEADFTEPELPDEEAWENERKTALAQIQNALKFCVQS